MTTLALPKPGPFTVIQLNRVPVKAMVTEEPATFVYL
jgi:hypothetical protein